MRRRLGGKAPAEDPRASLPGPLAARRLLNVVNLSTPLGLLAARLTRARVRPGPRGLVLADRARLGRIDAAAVTIGNVVLTRHDWDVLTRRRPALLAHEERHTWQWAVCGGLPFLPLYGVGVLWSWARTGDRAARNPFERGAGLADGGYRDRPVRPLRQLLATPRASGTVRA